MKPSYCCDWSAACHLPVKMSIHAGVAHPDGRAEVCTLRIPQPYPGLPTAVTHVASPLKRSDLSHSSITRRCQSITLQHACDNVAVVIVQRMRHVSHMKHDVCCPQLLHGGGKRITQLERQILRETDTLSRTQHSCPSASTPSNWSASRSRDVPSTK